MHQAISLLPNKLFYYGKLIDSNYVIKRKNIIEWGNIDKNNVMVDNNNGNNAEILIDKSSNENILWKNSVPKWLQYYSFLDVSGNSNGDGSKSTGERGGGNGGMSLSNDAEASVVVRWDIFKYFL